MALAARLDGRPTRVFVVLSDGECNEGAVWEAAMWAAGQRLDNLCAIVDCQRAAGDGTQRRGHARSNRWPTSGAPSAGTSREIDGHDVDRARRGARRAAVEPAVRTRSSPNRQGEGRVVHGGRPRVALPAADRPTTWRGRSKELRGRDARRFRPRADRGRRPTDERIVFLTGDLGFKLFDDFAARCPGRFFNVGVAEANMIGVAAGLALDGKRPFTYSIVPFVTARCLEQIRNDVCEMELPVTIVGVGGGYAYGPNGPTHHGVDDIGVMRSAAGHDGRRSVRPAGDRRRRACARSAQPGPAYLRLGRGEASPCCRARTTASRWATPTLLRRGSATSRCSPAARSPPRRSRRRKRWRGAGSTRRCCQCTR